MSRDGRRPRALRAAGSVLAAGLVVGAWWSLRGRAASRPADGAATTAVDASDSASIDVSAVRRPRDEGVGVGALARERFREEASAGDPAGTQRSSRRRRLRVVFEDGAPVAERQVRPIVVAQATECRNSEVAETALSKLRLDAAGSGTVDVPERSSLRIEGGDDGAPPFRSNLATIVGDEMRCVVPGATSTVYVVDAEGTPVSGLALEAFGRSAADRVGRRSLRRVVDGDGGPVPATAACDERPFEMLEGGTARVVF